MSTLAPMAVVSGAVSAVEAGWMVANPALSIVESGGRLLSDAELAPSSSARVSSAASTLLRFNRALQIKGYLLFSWKSAQKVSRLVTGRKETSEESQLESKAKQVDWIGDAVSNCGDLLTVMAIVSEVNQAIGGTTLWIENLFLPLGALLSTYSCFKTVEELIAINNFSFETSEGFEDPRWEKFLDEHTVKYFKSLETQEEALQTLGRRAEIDQVTVARKVNALLEKKRALLRIKVAESVVSMVGLGLALFPISAPVAAIWLGIGSNAAFLTAFVYEKVKLSTPIAPVRFQPNSGDGIETPYILA